MDSRCIYFVLDLTINDGKFDEFERIVKAMNEATATEAGALAYDWFLSKDGKRCRLVELYADADAVQAHLSGAAVQQWVPKLLEASSLSRFEVYGVPDAGGAAALEGFGAEIFRYWKGILAARTSAAH